MQNGRAKPTFNSLNGYDMTFTIISIEFWHANWMRENVFNKSLNCFEVHIFESLQMRIRYCIFHVQFIPTTVLAE